MLVFVPILFFYSPILFIVVLVFSLMGALASMYYSKKQRDAMSSVGKADSQRQEFISVCVNGIENVKGLALRTNTKRSMERFEANYILAADEMQKKSSVLKQYFINY